MKSQQNTILQVESDTRLVVSLWCGVRGETISLQWLLREEMGDRREMLITHPCQCGEGMMVRQAAEARIGEDGNLQLSNECF